MNGLNTQRIGEIMMCYIEWSSREKDLLYEEGILKAISTSLKYESIKTDVEISVMIIDNKYMEVINKTYRNIDTTTDVLSFPMIEYPKGVQLEKTISIQPVSPETGKVYLGDILISWDKVIEQSESYGHSVERELCFLVVHSMLHLLGYDHMNNNEEKMMKEKQEAILEEMEIIR